MPKQKSIYSLDNFRGLDKENKLTKVEPFRASEGKNFIIDSNTLKTRPALRVSDEIPFTIESGDFVIDWYEFKEVIVYITRFHIYASYLGATAVNETNSLFKLGINLGNDFNGNFDFSNLEPLFREEKNALFIFGLGNIYVFSYIQTTTGSPHRYVFYRIDSKPINLFFSESDYFEQFEKLPSAYEPTLFLGNDAFEDVNLLSNVRKYKTFAASGDITEGGFQSYYFPTDYEPTKHGEFPEFSVEFYEGKFDDLVNIYPIFIGVEGEHFDTGTLSNFGISDVSTPIAIQDIFYPINSFEFLGTSGDVSPNVITNITNLDQDWFFKSRVFGDTSRDAFTFILEYIRTNKTRLEDESTNHYLPFSVNIEYNAIFKNENGIIVENKIDRSSILVYIQLRSLEIDSFQLNQEQTLLSQIIETQDLNSPTYPAYPTAQGTFAPENTLDLSPNPISVSQLSGTDFRVSARNILSQNKTNFDNGDNVLVKAQYFQNVIANTSAEVNVNPTISQWTFFRDIGLDNQQVLANLATKNQKQYTLQEAFPTYPTFTADATFNLNNNTPIELVGFTQQSFVNDATNFFNANTGSFTNGQKIAIRGQYYENVDETIEVSPQSANFLQGATWISRTGPFLQFVETLVTTFNGPGTYTISFDAASASSTTITTVTGANTFRSRIEFYDNVNRLQGNIISSILFEDIYTTSLSGAKTITVPSGTQSIFIVVHAVDNSVNIVDPFNNTWNTQLFTPQVTQDVEYSLRQSFVLLADVTNVIDEDEDIVFGNVASIDDGLYPTFSNPTNLDVVTVPLISQSNENFLYGSIFVNQIRDYILNEEMGNLTNTQAGATRGGFARVKVQTEFNNTNKGVSIIIPFTYSKSFSQTTQRRQSMVYAAVVEKLAEANDTNQLFEFVYDDLEKRFELRLKDYFYDYNNEPSISLKVTFNENPDYEYIAKSRFGATFGSENRLFLAGNEEFPNIDRYNVSNDLLGNNVTSQSYELSYFPSRNYRVLGGKGAINGYVTATDNILYVTKEDYPNDDKLFIRQRILNENGVLGYSEFKTSVTKTPLNHRCIVRFNNDVVMLTKNGLYALELSENVLTDERLLKLRSGFINKDIVAKIEEFDDSKVFILENNLYMYIFIGQDVYVADSRYTARNENNIIENLSYEIVYWEFPQTFKTGHVTKNTFKILNDSGKFIYTLNDNQNQDDKFTRYDAITNSVDFDGNNAFIVPTSLQFLVTNPKEYTLRLYSGFKVVGVREVDYNISSNTITYINSNAFRGVEAGKIYFFKDNNNNFFPLVVNTSIPLNSFTYLGNISGSVDVIYESIANRPLYISTIFSFGQINYVRVSPYPQKEVPIFQRNQGENDTQYIARLKQNFKDNEDYYFTSNAMKDLVVSESNRIELVWISGITDFNSKMMEKTTFTLNLYATKKAQENSIIFGYRTRRHENLESERDINVSNPSTFNRLNFDNFGFNTFSETGFSMPMKENNFLYIQFYIQGFGQIEVNSFSVIYKNNRMLKTVG